jgi:translation elongation factor EF-4
VFEDRLRQEHEQSIIITAPTVPYKVKYKDGREVIVRNPHEFPNPDSDYNKIEGLYEPLVLATITLPDEYLGKVIELCEVLSPLLPMVRVGDSNLGSPTVAHKYPSTFGPPVRLS